MSRPSRQQQPQMPHPEALMGPPPLPPQMAFSPSQAPVNQNMPGVVPKPSHSQDVGEKYSKLKRKYFELEEKLRDAAHEIDHTAKRNLQWRAERNLLLERIAELETTTMASPNNPTPLSTAYPRSLANPRMQKIFAANLDQGIHEAELEDLDEDPLLRSRHIGPHIRKRQEAEQRERQEEEAKEAKRQARRPRGSATAGASGGAQKHKEGTSASGAGVHNAAAAANTSRNDNSHHHHSPLQYAHSPSGQRDSPWLVSENGTRLRLKPPAPPSNNAPESGAEYNNSMSAHHAPMQIDSPPSSYQNQHQHQHQYQHQPHNPPHHSPHLHHNQAQSHQYSNQSPRMHHTPSQYQYPPLPPPPLSSQNHQQSSSSSSSQHQPQPQTYAVPPPPPPAPQFHRASSRTPPPAHRYSSPPPAPPVHHSPSLVHSSSSRGGPEPSHAHSPPHVLPSPTPQSRVPPPPSPPQPQLQSQSQPPPQPQSQPQQSVPLPPLPPQPQPPQSQEQPPQASPKPIQQPRPPSPVHNPPPQTPQPRPQDPPPLQSTFLVISPREEKHQVFTIPPPPPPSSQLNHIQQTPPRASRQGQHSFQHEHPIILEGHSPFRGQPSQMILQPMQHYVTLSPSGDYRATPMDPNRAAQSQMQITLRPTGTNGSSSGRPSELQRQAKPKRLKAHTVTTKNHSIPTVPRDKDGRPLLPLYVGIMTVYNLGEICKREHFHTERYIFPVNYEVTRRYYSTVDPQTEVNYRCKILDGGDGPKFQIIADDNRDNPVLAGTATGAWSTIVKAANNIRNRQHSNSVSGPDFFGLGQNTIKHLIQELPGANELKNYVWQKFVEGGPLGGRHAAVIPALPDEADINGSHLVQHLNGIENANRLRAEEEAANAAGGSISGRRMKTGRDHDVTIGNGMATHFYSEQQGELIEIEDGERPKELQIIQVDSEDINNGQPARPRSNTTSMTILGAPTTMTSTIKPLTFHQEYAIPPPPPPDPAQHNRKERRGRKSSRARESDGFHEYVVPDSNVRNQSPPRLVSSQPSSATPATPRMENGPTSSYTPSQNRDGQQGSEVRSYFSGAAAPPPPPPPSSSTLASIMNAYPSPANGSPRVERS